MRPKLLFKHVLISVCLLSLSLSACLLQASVISTATPLSLPTESLSTAMPSPSGTIVVAFVKDGNIQVWDEATQQTQTILNTGDVLSVTTSEDGQRIAYTRRSWVGDVYEGYEQLALWAMDRDGGNPRELVSAQDLRQRIHPSERDSSNFYQRRDRGFALPSPARLWVFCRSGMSVPVNANWSRTYLPSFLFCQTIHGWQI